MVDPETLTSVISKLGLHDEFINTQVTPIKQNTKIGIIATLGTMLGLLTTAGIGLALTATPFAPLVPSLETGLLEESTILAPSVYYALQNLAKMYGR